MPIRPTDIFELAIALQESPDFNNNEVHRRNIIGRYYYGVFLIAREFTKVQNTGPGAHNEVVQRLKENPEQRRAGNRLATLRDARNSADYNIHKSIENRELSKCEKSAKAIRDSLQPRNN